MSLPRQGRGGFASRGRWGVSEVRDFSSLCAWRRSLGEGRAPKLGSRTVVDPPRRPGGRHSPLLGERQRGRDLACRDLGRPLCRPAGSERLVRSDPGVGIAGRRFDCEEQPMRLRRETRANPDLLEVPWRLGYGWAEKGNGVSGMPLIPTSYTRMDPPCVPASSPRAAVVTNSMSRLVPAKAAHVG